MANDAYEKSNIEGGQWSHGNWVCPCKKSVRWFTAKTDAHKGERFLRCSNFPQCKFFLWEKDEEEARQRTYDQQPNPRTPTKAPDSRTSALPTPVSKHSTSSRDAPARTQELFPQNGSAIPFQLSMTGVQRSQHSDLTTRVVNFLHGKGIELCVADRLLLDNIISTEVAVHETRLQQAQETIQKFANQEMDD